MGKHITVCAGIDIGKRKLDVALAHGTEQLQVANTADGHRILSAWLRRHGVKRVGVEASGGYEQAIVLQLRCQRFVVVVFQPAQVRAYAKFHLQRAKNDKIDAALIADCTAATKTIREQPDPRLVAFAAHLTLIEQMTEDIAHLKTRRETCHDQRIRHHWDREIARLKGLLQIELKTLTASIRKHDDLAARLDLIDSVAGVGLRTALAILIRMPEIGRVTREQVAALAGLAPYDDDSGQHIGMRHIEGGRTRLRKSLYTAALPAAFRWNPQLMAIYRRLTAAGKPHKVALVACARKLLIYTNTVVARGTPWTEMPAAI